MYIYKIFNNSTYVSGGRRDFAKNHLPKLVPEDNCIFVYDHRLYKRKVGSDVGYIPLTIEDLHFSHAVELRKISTMCDLVWYDDERVYCDGYYVKAKEVLGSELSEKNK